MNEYNKQASDFLKATQTKIRSKFLKYDYHFEGDKDKRDIYLVTISRGNRSFSFNFGQSISESGSGEIHPDSYDILACLQKYEVGDLKDFCDDFGYDTDSIKAIYYNKMYKAVAKEWSNVQIIWTDAEINQLQEIW